MNDLNILDAMKERLLSVEPPIGYAIRAVHATPPESLAVVPAIVPEIDALLDKIKGGGDG